MDPRTLLSAEGTLQFSTATAGQYQVDVAAQGRLWPSVAAAEAATIPGPGSTTLALLVAGYAVPGDTGRLHLYRYSATEPSHPAKLQSADGAWWELADDAVSPMILGADGSGATDDIGHLEDAVAAAVALGVPVEWGPRTYGVSRPLEILTPFVRLLGLNGYSQSADQCISLIKKLSGFSGEAAIIDGTPGATYEGGTMDLGSLFMMVGIGVDGNGQEGDGVQIWGGGLQYLERVASFENEGWGFTCDGAFFPKLIRCVSRNNGQAGVGGGGFKGTNDVRENADGAWAEGHINGCATSILLDTRDGNNAQTSWEFRKIEIGGPLPTATEAGAGYCARIKGGRWVNFIDCKFVSGGTVTHEKLLHIGDATGSVEDVTLDSCVFQFESFVGVPGDTTPIPRFCITLEGDIRRLRILNAIQAGTAKFMDTAGADSVSLIYMQSPAIPAGQLNDPDGYMRNLLDSYAGVHPIAGGQGETWFRALAKDGNGDPVASKLRLMPQKSDGSNTNFIIDGEASIVDVGHATTGLGGWPASALPSSPEFGQLFSWNGIGSDAALSSGSGLYYFGGSGWEKISA